LIKVTLQKLLKTNHIDFAFDYEKQNKLFTTKLLAHNTRYALWAANVLLAVFAPAFPLSLLRQEIRPQAAQAHSLGRYGQI